MIPEKLIKLRNKNKWTLKEAAEKIGISSTVLFYLENGRNKPTSDTIIKICECYKISSDWLLEIQSAEIKKEV